MKGRVLIIAGSDPSGGAGLQADIKTVTALGGYAMTAVTALTVQNTKGVTGVMNLPPAFIRDQILAVLDDIGADAVKIGMIGEKGAALEIAAVLDERARGVPIVLDPVLIATSGDALAGDGVAAVLRRVLTPMAALVTPNSDELAALAGMPVRTADEAAFAAAAFFRSEAPRALLAKGGHLPGAEVADQLFEDGSGRPSAVFRNKRIETRAGHGTGCTLASAIATGLAQGRPLKTSIERAIAYVSEALADAPGFGAGAGPLGHACRVKSD
jgi:hydroxymethylpyrimidine/phosphomethylpyrimidine kinase